MSFFSRPIRHIRWRSAHACLSAVALLAGLFAVSGCSLPFGGAASARATPTPTMTAHALTKITEFPIPTTGAYSIAMAAGGDGNIWFGEYKVGAGPGGLPPVSIDRITPVGGVTTFPVRAQNVAVTSMATGSDGNVWFLETGGPPSASGALSPYAIGRMTPSGALTEFPLPGGGVGITSGPDGALWFTEFGASGANQISGKVGRITTTGAITDFPLPTPGIVPQFITSGRDGALWFVTTAFQTPESTIGRMTTTGDVKLFPLPQSAGRPGALVAGPDGNVWMILQPQGKGQSSRLGRMTPTGGYSDFPLKSLASQAFGFAAGPDGALWIGGQGMFDRVTVTGAESSVALPDPRAVPLAIINGPNATLWFSEVVGGEGAPGAVGKIGRLS